MNNFIFRLMEIQFTYKVAHWYANNWQVHAILDKFNESARDLFDEMIETARSGRPETAPDNVELFLHTLHKSTPEKLRDMVLREVDWCRKAEERKDCVIASQLDQLGAYLSVMANNLAMVQ